MRASRLLSYAIIYTLAEDSVGTSARLFFRPVFGDLYSCDKFSLLYRLVVVPEEAVFRGTGLIVFV